MIRPFDRLERRNLPDHTLRHTIFGQRYSNLLQCKLQTRTNHAMLHHFASQYPNCMCTTLLHFLIELYATDLNGHGHISHCFMSCTKGSFVQRHFAKSILARRRRRHGQSARAREKRPTSRAASRCGCLLSHKQETLPIAVGAVLIVPVHSVCLFC